MKKLISVFAVVAGLSVNAQVRFSAARDTSMKYEIIGMPVITHQLRDGVNAEPVAWFNAKMDTVHISPRFDKLKVIIIGNRVYNIFRYNDSSAVIIQTK